MHNFEGSALFDNDHCGFVCRFVRCDLCSCDYLDEDCSKMDTKQLSISHDLSAFIIHIDYSNTGNDIFQIAKSANMKLSIERISPRG